MGRYGCYGQNIVSFLSLSLCFLFYPVVLSALSQTQTNTMTNLSALLNATVPSWNMDRNSDPCTWKEVKCDNSNYSVTEVSLSRQGLSSSQFLPLLCQINTLQRIDVSNNLLSSIPVEFIADCGKVEELKVLNFSNNRLNGSFPTFDGFNGLESLDMSFNKFQGKIDLQLAELVRLKSLDLSFNNFTGSIPTNLGKSMVLEKLVLSTNNFEGKIPDEILAYKNLTSIDLSANQLTGSIPIDIGNLSRLESLILSSNHLEGGIPTTVSSIATLVRFAANQNMFTGAVPPGITRFLRSLDLSYNKLNGSIPAELLCRSNLQLVDLSNNKLSGTLPTNISHSLVRLRLGNNLLNGTIPSASLAKLQRLMYLELEGNNLTGAIPSELGSCQNLALLSLAQNHLTRELPAELGNLRNLQSLKVQMNKLVGPIPVQIAQLKKLQILNLSSNSFNGSIPSEISNLNNLTNLHLQGNSLSGSIPLSISHMTSLLELQLGHNHLNGTIPDLPLNLQIALNLSNNLFEGPIPHTVDLNNLEVLDLSNNRFSGEIPDFLTKIQTLTQLVLSNNELSGVIPKFPPWVKVDTTGNSDLMNTTSNTSQQLVKKGKSVAMAVLIAIAAAVFVVGLVALLIVSISRRYYRVNDENIQSAEDLSLPQVIIQGNLLTPNGIHRSNIDFCKAMEAVTETSNITLKTRFSTYYKAIMPSGAIYFMKKLNWSEKIFPQGSRDKFVKDLEVLAKLNNSNVMTPLAYVLSNDSAYILYEFFSNGSLYDVLHGSMGYSLDWASRYSIAVLVAQGLSFLHGYASGPILLLDLSSKSIMLKSFKEPLVGDIELYKVIDPTKSTGSLSAVAGSVGYIPPEYAYTMRVTTAGNVYSFGVILLELLTGKPAVTEGTELVKWVSRNSTKEDHILDFNVSRASQAVRNQMLAMLKIALVCVGTSPEARPKMKSVLRMLLNAR